MICDHFVMIGADFWDKKTKVETFYDVTNKLKAIF